MNVRMLLPVAGLLVALSAPALAFQCPGDMGKIDEALPNATLNEEQLTQVQELRAEGERLHSEGQHQEAVDTLAQAMAILGIE